MKLLPPFLRKETLNFLYAKLDQKLLKLKLENKKIKKNKYSIL